MKTIIPSNFLRVKHKIFAVYAGLDKELKTGPTLLYLWLYFFCHDKDYCWPSQKLLSVLCKTSVRSVQNHLAALVRLEYIAVEQQGTRNIYRLLESDRVRRQIVEAGMELMDDENFSPLKLKLAESKGEKSSRSLLKELKKKEEEINTPLSPLAQTRASGSRHERCVCPSRSPLAGSGRGDSSGSGLRRKLQDEFPRLWELWPRKQDRFGAYQEYVRLAKSGYLPPLDELVRVVKRLMGEDRSWKKGYVPNLRFWLRDRRWLDLPFAGQESAPMGDAASVSPHLSPEEMQAREHAVLRRVIEPDRRSCAGPETRLREEAEARLCAMWPQVPRGMIAAGLCLARGSLHSIAARLTLGKALVPPPVPDARSIASLLREVAA